MKNSSGATRGAHLKWDEFMTPGIPMVTNDMPPGVKEVYFHAMVSTLIYGMRDAVLVDAFMTIKQANALADWVAASGKNRTGSSGINWKNINQQLGISYEICQISFN
jgi:hypothetical protein